MPAVRLQRHLSRLFGSSMHSYSNRTASGKMLNVALPGVRRAAVPRLCALSRLATGHVQKHGHGLLGGRVIHTTAPASSPLSPSPPTPSMLSQQYPALSAHLARLHQASSSEDLSGTGINSINQQDVGKRDFSRYSDKMIALEQDKSELVLSVLRATGATRVFEAGTSFGVSTTYLLTAVWENAGLLGGSSVITKDQREGKDGNEVLGSTPMVYGSEYEPGKISKAKENISIAASILQPRHTVDRNDANANANTEDSDIPAFTFLEGDILRTAATANIAAGGPLDAVLFDIWAELALPTFKILEPSLSDKAVVFVDNWTAGLQSGVYNDFKKYMASKGWCFATIPFENGFGIATRSTGASSR
ncbi:hypothetical protein BCV70DRAFT_200856 [Testicularia cyperi]|uniref:S-adenosyl-L-methionine-dependent methyltransferase n=1 Tax=Testicularia cyperi TaxID=1882483 RepID=A0A317XPI3_9BASI|nr:hypothetical protein BCV70DRAFT_200856 [Testicularia cyperi]